MDFIHKYPYSNLHELNLDWLIDTTKGLMVHMDKLQEEFDQIVVVTEDHIQQMIDAAIAANNLTLYNDLANLKAQITTEYVQYVTSQINQLRIYLDNQDIHYDQLAQSYAQHALNESKSYTDSKVLDYTMMINPITGQYDDVRNVVDDIVAYFHTEDSLTASEYDALDLTAGYYDSKDLTAYDYDFNGKLRLP